MNKAIFLATTLLLYSCSNNTSTDTSATSHTAENTTGLQHRWKLHSYRVNSKTTQFTTGTNYTLTFNEHSNLFGMTTDCNSIGGEFAINNDTIRFSNIAVTEMACENMEVEKNMLQLFNDTTAYAIHSGDTLLYTAPHIGTATFIQK